MRSSGIRVARTSAAPVSTASRAAASSARPARRSRPDSRPAAPRSTTRGSRDGDCADGPVRLDRLRDIRPSTRHRGRQDLVGHGCRKDEGQRLRELLEELGIRRDEVEGDRAGRVVRLDRRRQVARRDRRRAGRHPVDRPEGERVEGAWKTFTWRSTVRLTSEARNGVPSLYMIPGLSVKVQVRPPSVGVGTRSARLATIVVPSTPPTCLNPTSPSFVRVNRSQAAGSSSGRAPMGMSTLDADDPERAAPMAGGARGCPTHREPGVRSVRRDVPRSAEGADTLRDLVRRRVDAQDLGGRCDRDPDAVPDRHRLGWSPTSTVATTRFVAGSIRMTVPSRLFTTHTWSTPAAIEEGPLPTLIGLMVAPDSGSTLTTAPASKSDTHTDPAPVATPVGVVPDRIRGRHVGHGVDPRQGAVEAVGHPDPAVVSRDVGRAVPDGDVRDHLARRRADAADRPVAALATQTAPWPTATDEGRHQHQSCRSPALPRGRRGPPTRLPASVTQSDPSPAAIASGRLPALSRSEDARPAGGDVADRVGLDAAGGTAAGEARRRCLPGPPRPLPPPRSAPTRPRRVRRTAAARSRGDGRASAGRSSAPGRPSAP